MRRKSKHQLILISSITLSSANVAADSVDAGALSCSSTCTIANTNSISCNVICNASTVSCLPTDSGIDSSVDASIDSGITDATIDSNPGIDTGAPDASTNCGMQLGNTAPAFCETFDNTYLITTRSGQLDGTLWGVARTFGENLGQQQYNNWATVTLQTCGSTVSVLPPNDVVVCGGQLREGLNDNPSGVFEQGGVVDLAMYPKQRFDFTNRVGHISFDVTNDTHSTHSAWPELWITDLPSPAPFVHFGSWVSVPQNAFAVRFANGAPPNVQGECPNANNLSSFRWTVDSAVVVRNYTLEDQMAVGGQGTNCGGYPSCVQTGLTVTPLDCVVEDPNGPNGGTNHVEVQITPNQIDVYATDAGKQTPLKHIAVITNANLTLTNGLVWIEDAHYNADKGYAPSERQHTFAWDNLAFDGPILPRDLAYDALDQTVPGVNNTANLGQVSLPNQVASWNVLNVVPNSMATSVKVLFNSYAEQTSPSLFNVIVNGHAQSTPWPFPDTQTGTWRTVNMTIPASELVLGTNVVGLGGDQVLVTSNVDILLVGAGGIVMPPSH